MVEKGSEVKTMDDDISMDSGREMFDVRYWVVMQILYHPTLDVKNYFILSTLYGLIKTVIESHRVTITSHHKTL